MKIGTPTFRTFEFCDSCRPRLVSSRLAAVHARPSFLDALDWFDSQKMSDAASTSRVMHVYMYVPFVGSWYTSRRDMFLERMNDCELIPCRDPSNRADANCIFFREPIGNKKTCFCKKEYAAWISPLVDAGVLRFVDAKVISGSFGEACIHAVVRRRPCNNRERRLFAKILTFRRRSWF